MDTQPLSMREFSGYGYGTNEHARRRNETEADLQTSLCQWNFPVLTLQETAHYNASLWVVELLFSHEYLISV